MVRAIFKALELLHGQDDRKGESRVLEVVFFMNKKIPVSKIASRSQQKMAKYLPSSLLVTPLQGGYCVIVVEIQINPNDQGV